MSKEKCRCNVDEYDERSDKSGDLLERAINILRTVKYSLFISKALEIK
jgi:hypothetical protein